MSKVVVFDHPLIQHKLSIMRDKNTGSKDFRQLLEEIALLMGYEVTRDLPLEDVEIETPICRMTAKEVSGRKLAIVPILTFFPPITVSRATSLYLVSVVMIAWRASTFPVFESFATDSSKPSRIFWTGSCWPITPVEQTRTSFSETLSFSETAFASFLAFS